MRLSPSPVKSFFNEALSKQLPTGFEDFRRASDEFNKTAISLSPLEAGILQSFVSLQGGPLWVEIGTLTGFSGFCIAKALPSDGHLWTCEKDPKLAEQARLLFKQAGVESKITVVEGDAVQMISSLSTKGPFDGIFIDGNKGAYTLYLDWAEKNLKPGALIIADNVFLGGALWLGSEAETSWGPAVIEKMKGFLDRLMDPSKYQTTLIPTSEGLIVARKL